MIREGKGQVQVEVRNKKRQNEGRDEVVISGRKKKGKTGGDLEWWRCHSSRGYRSQRSAIRIEPEQIRVSGRNSETG